MAEEAGKTSEHSEHEHGHGGHGHGLGKIIGLTMAVLGVFLALCSAFVGGSRTELITTMVEQTGASLKYQTVSTKYRMIEANLVQLHSLLPDPRVFKEAGDQIARSEKGLPKSSQLENQIMSLRVRQVLTTVTPTHADMLTFVTQLRKLDKQAEAALEWSESYEAAIQAHSKAAEHYEWGQLCAEVGIVICSVGLLLGNRPAWVISIVFGVVCVCIVVMTSVQVSSELSTANAKIATLEKHYTDLSSEDKGADEELFKQIESEDGAPANPAGGPPSRAGHE